jgi:hypothetical protein
MVEPLDAPVLGQPVQGEATMAFATAPGPAPVTTMPLSMSSGVYQAATPAMQRWLSQHDNVADLLARYDVQTANLATGADTAYEGTRRTMQAKLDTDADLARVYHDARNGGIAVDEGTKKRLLRAQQNAAAVHERATATAADVSRESAWTREATNNAIALANQLAASGAGIVLAPPVTLPKKHPVEILKTQRAIIQQCTADEKAAKAAPIPEEEAIAAAVAELDSHAKDGAKVIWPMEPTNAMPVPGLIAGNVVNVKALIADLLRDEMVARIERIMHTYYATLPASLDVLQRRTLLRDIASKRLDAERIEVAAVLACWDEGIDVPLRPDTDLMVMLGIEAVTEGEPEPKGFIGKMADAALGH